MKISHVFWVIFYFLVGAAVIAVGIYLRVASAGHPISYLIGGIIIGPLIWHEAYTLIRDRNKP